MCHKHVPDMHELQLQACWCATLQCLAKQGAPLNGIPSDLQSLPLLPCSVG